jgi:hypothetical protein
VLNSTVLDVTIGLVLIYLVLSLFCSAVKEWIARFLALRATALRQGINELVAGGAPSGLAAALHDHPLIEALKPSKAPVVPRLMGKGELARYPSYISSQTFALAVMDLTTSVSAAGALGGAKATLLSNLRSASSAAPGDAATPVPAVIKKILADVNGDSELMRQRLEQWFDDSMQRVSGWYKRRTQAWLFGIGVVAALVLNADTLTIVRQLQHDPSVREALVKQADQVVASANGLPLDSVQARVKIGVDSITHAGVGIGWDTSCSPEHRMAAWFGGGAGPAAGACASAGASIFGILLTAIALSLGAPFWFDLLNKVTNLRQAGAPPARPQAR